MIQIRLSPRQTFAFVNAITQLSLVFLYHKSMMDIDRPQKQKSINAHWIFKMNKMQINKQQFKEVQC